MNETIRKVLFIASVALNVAFATTYLTHKLPSLLGVHRPSASRGPLFLQLDLAPSQFEHFRAERDTFQSRLHELGHEVKAKQVELIDLLTATRPDQLDIGRKQEEIQRLQRRVRNRVIAHFLQASTFLTSEQRNRFFELIKAHIESSGPGSQPWMRPFEQDRSGASTNEGRAPTDGDTSRASCSAPCAVAPVAVGRLSQNGTHRLRRPRHDPLRPQNGCSREGMA